jgi:hypothetical protein
MKLYVVSALAIILYAYLYFAMQAFHQYQKVAYDCRLAEISPDYPPIVKQRCRELIGENKNGR